MEQDNKLKDLLKGYNPRPAQTDREFMNTLLDRMAAADALRTRFEAKRRSDRRAIASAAAVGFVCGILFALVIPSLSGFIGSLRFTGPDSESLLALAYWLAAGATTLLTALATFDLCASR